MPMINRLTRLLRADVHGVLDRIEEPDLMLRQALREMEEALAESARRIELQRRSREALDRRQQEIASSLATVAEELELCLDADNEPLARILLRRRLEGERLLAHLLRQASRLDAEISEGQQALDQQRGRFESLRQQAEVQAPSAEADVGAPQWSAEQFSVSDADVELALLRERRRRT